MSISLPNFFFLLWFLRHTYILLFNPFLCHIPRPHRLIFSLILWNMAGIFQATSEDLWRGTIYGSWGTVFVLLFIAICHLFYSKKNVSSLLSRFQTSSLVADRHTSSPSCECPPPSRWFFLSFLFWLLSMMIIYLFWYLCRWLYSVWI